MVILSYLNWIWSVVVGNCPNIRKLAAWLSSWPKAGVLLGCKSAHRSCWWHLVIPKALRPIRLRQVGAGRAWRRPRLRLIRRWTRLKAWVVVEASERLHRCLLMSPSSVETFLREITIIVFQSNPYVLFAAFLAFKTKNQRHIIILLFVTLQF